MKGDKDLKTYRDVGPRSNRSLSRHTRAGYGSIVTRISHLQIDRRKEEKHTLAPRLATP